MKYVEVLNDLGLVKESLYYSLKYGTTNINKIVLIKNGLSLSLANLIVDQYQEYAEIDEEQNTFSFNPRLAKEMELQQENEILIFEVKYFNR